MVGRGFLLALLCALVLPGCPSQDEVEGDAQGECDDGEDNDGDGKTDCADPGCANSPACAGDDDDSGSSGDDDDATGDDDDATGDDDDATGTLPEVIEASGVVYAVHYLSDELLAYRVDGATPYEELEVDLDSPAHDLTLDPYNDLLYVVQDVARRVLVLSLDRPSAPGTALTAPVELATMDFASPAIPRFARVDPFAHRLYVVAAPSGGAFNDMQLHVFDVSDPSSPAELSVETIEVTTSLDIDPVRRVLFVVDMNNDELVLYDLASDDLVKLPGDPIDLIELFPQENQTSFQARNLTVDPWNNRGLAARAQGGLSELIAFEYPDVIPAGSTKYSDLASHDDVTFLADFFDVEEPLEDRSNLLDAFTPLSDPESGNVMFVAGAWNGVAATSLVVPMTPDLDVHTGCGAYEGFGCWLQSHYGGSPGSYMYTDGAACADWTHGVMVSTSYDVYDESSPGLLHLFSFDGAFAMEPWLTDQGSDLAAGGLPIGVVCH
jgi:hypothetical protein